MAPPLSTSVMAGHHDVPGKSNSKPNIPFAYRNEIIGLLALSSSLLSFTTFVISPSLSINPKNREPSSCDG